MEVNRTGILSALFSDSPLLMLMFEMTETTQAAEGRGAGIHRLSVSTKLGLKLHCSFWSAGVCPCLSNIFRGENDVPSLFQVIQGRGCPMFGQTHLPRTESRCFCGVHTKIAGVLLAILPNMVAVGFDLFHSAAWN